MELKEILKKVVANRDEWLELRYHKRTSLDIEVKNGRLREATRNILSGVAIRALVDGCWGFVSTSETSYAGLSKAVSQACKSAKEAAPLKKEKVKGLASLPAKKEKVDFARSNNQQKETSLEEKIREIRQADNLLQKAGEDIIASQVSYSEYQDEKIIVTSDGIEVEITDPKCDVGVVAYGVKDSQQERAHVSKSITGNWTELFSEKSLADLVDEAVSLLRQRLTAEHVSGGEYQVILDPALVGVLAHEAIGHTVEADFVEAGSVVQGKIGEQVASELVTLVDDGNAAGAGRTLVDDEGCQADKTIIIDKGILQNYLHNRESAFKYDTEPGGNARAFTYRDEPIIRMTNTYIMPGKSELAEMIEGVSEGFLLKGMAQGGQADSTAEFMFDVLEAYKIEEGQISHPVKGITLTGQAFEVLKSVDAVSKDFALDLGRGYCGKGQPAKVDAGGPYIRCKLMIGGQQ